MVAFEVDIGASKAFAGRAIRDWLAEPGDPTLELFPHQWASTALKVVRSAWRDQRRRAEIQAAIADTQAPAPMAQAAAARRAEEKRREAEALTAAAREKLRSRGIDPEAGELPDPSQVRSLIAGVGR